MKLKRILFVILLCSLLLFLPYFAPAEEVKVFPFEPVTVVINVKSPRIIISTDIIPGIETEISYMNPIDNQLESFRNITIFEKETINLPNRGNYLLNFTSIVLGDIKIDQDGIPFQTPIIVTILLLVNVSYRYYLRFRNVIDY